MEIKKDYTALFNPTSDIIEKLEDLMGKVETCLQLLKNAQIAAEEMNRSEDSEQKTNKYEAIL